MKEITVSIIYEAEEAMAILDQIEIAIKKYVPNDMEITDISLEKQWLGRKSKVTFKGVEQ